MRLFKPKVRKIIGVCPFCGTNELVDSTIKEIQCKDCKQMIYFSDVSGRFEMEPEEGQRCLQ